MESVSREVYERDNKHINERIDKHDERLDDHDKRINTLEKSDATNTNEIKNLCNRIGNQTTAIWGLVGTILTTLLGFFIWFIQSK